MKIAIGSDHAGFELKESVKKHLDGKYDIDDFGSFSSDAADYPDVAKRLALAVSKGRDDFGILICGTGIGMAITANKVPGIRAALCYDKYTAEVGRAHNDANILAIGGRTTSTSSANEIVDTFLSTKFEGGRHGRRIRKIEPSGMRVVVSFLGERDPGKILEKLPGLEAAGVDGIHWDVMDGKYNPNNTLEIFTPQLVREAAERTSMDSEAHLMVSEPWDFAGKFRDCSLIIFQIEACPRREDVLRTIGAVRSLGKKVGIAIEPVTTLDAVDEYLGMVDLVLVMSVRTGYAGQDFIDVAGKIRHLASLRSSKELGFEIECDGGMNAATAKLVREAGCDAVASAAYIMNSDYKEAVKELKFS